MSLLGVADTGTIVALLDPTEQHHTWAADQFRWFPSLLTCEAVISEACFLARKLHNGEARVMELLTTGALEIAYGLHGDEERVSDLMAKYADVPMSFADACLVRMSERYSDSEVVTLDSDFRVYRRHGSETIRVSLP